MKFTGYVFLITILTNICFGLAYVLYLLGLIAYDIVTVFVIILCIVCLVTLITHIVIEYRDIFK